MEALIKSWENLPFVIQWSIGFWFNVIFLRGIIGKRITTYVDEKGWFDHMLVEPFVREWQRLKVAVRHEIDKHNTELEHCYTDRCSAL